MQRLEVSGAVNKINPVALQTYRTLAGAVRPLYGPLGVKGLRFGVTSTITHHITVTIIYRVIHKFLWDFRPLRYGNRDGHAEGEHVNRGRDTQKKL